MERLTLDQDIPGHLRGSVLALGNCPFGRA